MTEDEMHEAFHKFAEEIANPVRNRILAEIERFRLEFAKVLGEKVVVHRTAADYEVDDGNSGVDLLLGILMDEAERAEVDPGELHFMFHQLLKAQTESDEEREERKRSAS